MRIQAVPIVRTRVARAAALSMRFTDNDILDPRVTFTRASQATHFDSTGRLVTDANDVARFDYDPVTLQPRGLLIEESRTNLLLHSRDMTQAAWSKTDVTAARTQVGIDGVANTACLMTEGVAGTAILDQIVGAVTAGSTLTGSMVLKRGNTDWVRLLVRETTGTDGAQAWFNLNTGVKGTVAAIGAATNNSSTITSLGGGWYRCTVTTTPNGSYTISKLTSTSAPADNSGTRVNNATYIVDCAQLEVGAFASPSVITTGAATATRAIDLSSATAGNFSSWFNSAAGTFVVEFERPPALGFMLTVSDNTSNNRFVIGHNGASTTFRDARGGVSAAPTDVASATATVKAAFAYSATESIGAANGALSTPSTRTSLNIVADRLYIGSNEGGSGSFANTRIRSIRYYNTRLPNATLQALTA